MIEYDVIMTSDKKDIHEGKLNMLMMPRLINIQKDNAYHTEIYIPEIMMHPPIYTIWKMETAMRAEYSYTHELEYWPGPTKSNAIRQWVDEMRIPCTQINRLWYFKTDEDRLLFIMVWG